MRFFLDTEFIEDGSTIELLSIGIVSEEGESLYAENVCADRSRANDWVKTNVLPHLHPLDCPDDSHLCPLATPDMMRRDIQAFTGYNPVFWGYYCAYDWVALCQLFGRMIDLPSDWPRYCNDLRQSLDIWKMKHITQPESDPHHALNDAEWIRATWAKQVGV